MSSPSVAKRMLYGAAAGIVGTLLLQVVRGASQKWAPGTIAPIKTDPGEFMFRRVKYRLPGRVVIHMPDAAEVAAGYCLGFGYGATFGALYGLVRPRGGNALADGTALGLICWAAGYLGWLSATGLMEPIWKHTPAQAAGPAVRHAIYGIGAAGAYTYMTRALEQ